jgi:cation:H+ antiporter
MVYVVLLLLLGFVVLIAGASALVNGASDLARRFGVSDLAIGLTIVAFGTSAPEWVVNVMASFKNHPEIVLSNILGSNIINLFVILGLAGLITPLVVQTGTVWKEIPVSFLSLVVMFLLANNFFILQNKSLSRIDGAVLLVLFGLFLFYVFRQLKGRDQENELPQKNSSVWKITGLLILGFACLIAGGRLIVANAIEIATIFGISEKIVGLTIVALGTSLPELATSVVAAIKKNSDIAVGNIIGSNIFNILFILGTSAIIRPVVYNPVFNLEMYFLVIGTCILFLAMFTGKKKKLDRWEAGVLIILYLVYLFYITNPAVQIF